MILDVGLSGWIVQDGNYDDFAVGEERTFALEFAPVTVGPGRGALPNLRHVHESVYDFDGTVVFLHGAVVLDVGVLVFHGPHGRSFDERFGAGASVSGRLWLGVDPFFWFEELSLLPDAPNLFSRWRIEGIERDTSPWIEAHDPNGRRMLRRDPGARSSASVARTDARHDDDGRADYVLRVRLLGPSDRRALLAREARQGAWRPKCPRCETTLPELSAVPPALRARVQREREASPLQAMRLLMDEMRWGIRDAKRVVLHLATAGRCPRCRQGDIRTGNPDTCARCGALVLRW